MADWLDATEFLAAWIGEGAPTDEAKITLWIQRAERLIRHDIPGIQTRIDEPEPDLLDNVKDVVQSMVERRFRNPNGTRQVSSTTGPFSEQVTFGGNDPGVLELLDNELALLTGTPSSGQRAFTVDMIPVTSPFSPHYVEPTTL